MPRLVGLGAMAMAGSVVVTASAGAANPTLVVRVIDHANTRPLTLIEAQHQLARVYGVEGIRIAWREGPAHAPADGGAEVTVLILSDAMAKHKIASEHIDSQVLGTAAPSPMLRAWIFLSRIEQAAFARGVSPGKVLGHVIAHEVAHVVGRMHHAKEGVMAAQLRFRFDTVQGFTKEQEKQLRAAVESNAAAVLIARSK
jgi:hypothetical protein